MTGFIIGLFVGSFLGVMLMCILVVGRDSEERAEKMRRKAEE